MSDIEDTQKQILDLLTRLANGEPIKDVNMSAKAATLDMINKEADAEGIKELLFQVQILPDFLRQFKGDLNLQTWVDFIVNDLGPELAPLKKLMGVLDQFIDSRIDKTAERVGRLVALGLSEETALKIVQGIATDLTTGAKKGAEMIGTEAGKLKATK